MDHPTIATNNFIPNEPRLHTLQQDKAEKNKDDIKEDKKDQNKNKEYMGCHPRSSINGKGSIKDACL